MQQDGRLPRGLEVMLTIATAMIVIAGLRTFSATLGPIFLAVVIALVVYPVRAAVLRLGAPAWLAGLVFALASFSVLLGLGIALAWSVERLVNLISTDAYDERLEAAQNDLADLLRDFGLQGDDLGDIVGGLDVGAIGGQLTAALSGALGLGTAISVLAFTGVFVAMDAAKFDRSITAIEGARPGVASALRNFASQTRRYFVVASIFGLIVAVLDVVALIALGVPLAIVWGLVAFITNFIPNIGFFIENCSSRSRSSR